VEIRHDRNCHFIRFALTKLDAEAEASPDHGRHRFETGLQLATLQRSAWLTGSHSSRSVFPDIRAGRRLLLGRQTGWRKTVGRLQLIIALPETKARTAARGQMMVAATARRKGIGRTR